MYVGLKQPLGDGERCVTPARASAKETTYDTALSASLCTSKFQASSVLDSSLNQPYLAKIGGSKGWCPSAANPGTEFIQIDFTSPFRVCAVDTQGHHSRFVSSYQVAYSLDGSTWLSVTLENKNDLVGTRHTV